MKKIGLIFALKEELDASIKGFKLIEKINIFNLEIYKCIYNEIECFLVESGIGKVNAARTTQILIDVMKVEYIINAGVAGSLKKSIKIGDIIVGNKLVQHDFDLTAFNREKGEIPNIGKYISSDKTLIEKANNIKTNNNIYVGVIASGDVFVNNEKESNKIYEQFNALCVEMEGASIAQVCFLSEIPFLVIRAISDSPNEKNNNLTYEEFLKTSSEEVARFIKQLIEKV